MHEDVRIVAASTCADAGNTLQAVRINCDGMISKSGLLQTVALPRNGKGLFDGVDPKKGTCPVLALAGVPCVLRRLDGAAEGCSTKAHFDNQWSTFFMIEPVSGFAPPDWQDYVGPTIMYKADGSNLTEDDVMVLNDCVSTMLDRYADGPGAVDAAADFPDELKCCISNYKQMNSKVSLTIG